MINSLLDTLMRHRRWLLLMAVAWMGMIFALSAQPSLPLPALFSYQDKLMHFLFFGVLGMLFALFVMSDGSRPTLWHVLLVTLLVMGYGGLDEFHQSFVPGRSADILDMVADTAGGLCAALLIMALLKRHTSR